MLRELSLHEISLVSGGRQSLNHDDDDDESEPDEGCQLEANEDSFEEEALEDIMDELYGGDHEYDEDTNDYVDLDSDEARECPMV